VVGVLIGAATLYTAAVKLDGGPATDTFAPRWLAGVLPNLAAGFVLPLLPLVPPRVVRFRELVAVAVLAFAGLTVYEFMQLKMPRRTFDWFDILASAVGAAAAVGVARGLFFDSPHEE
jgi:hypothetical protein